ncbi:hypothetical protein [Paraburkholderia terrae]
MSAQRIYTFGLVFPGETKELFIHGYTKNDFVTFCIFPRDVLFAGEEEPRPSQAVATMSEGDVAIHVDETIGHHLFVTSKTKSHFIAVDIYELKETVHNPS